VIAVCKFRDSLNVDFQRWQNLLDVLRRLPFGPDPGASLLGLGWILLANLVLKKPRREKRAATLHRRRAAPGKQV
jgi:hypothetical protein